MKKKAVIFLCVFFSVAAASTALMYRYAQTPLDPSAKEVTVVIPAGQGFGDTARMIADAGCIAHPALFAWVARVTGADVRARAGEYRLSGAMPPLYILAILKEGRSVRHRVTVVEGFDLKKIAAAVEKAGLCPAKAFLDKARDPDLAANMGLDGSTVEGYLFPDTYFFEKDVGPEKIIAAMVERFRRVFTPAWEKRARELGMSVNQAVTLASIIEKETGDERERPLVSSVLHNRLALRMRLQSDPTVIYGLVDFDGDLTRKHLHAYTPYNTYVIFGLPPGPIASPGAGSLRAALYPAQTDYLYFVSKNDGTHCFSASLADQNRAVRKFQIQPTTRKNRQARGYHASGNIELASVGRAAAHGGF